MDQLEEAKIPLFRQEENRKTPPDKRGGHARPHPPPKSLEEIAPGNFLGRGVLGVEDAQAWRPALSGNVKPVRPNL